MVARLDNLGVAEVRRRVDRRDRQTVVARRQRAHRLGRVGDRGRLEVSAADQANEDSNAGRDQSPESERPTAESDVHPAAIGRTTAGLNDSARVRCTALPLTRPAMGAE